MIAKKQSVTKTMNLAVLRFLEPSKWLDSSIIVHNLTTGVEAPARTPQQVYAAISRLAGMGYLLRAPGDTCNSFVYRISEKGRTHLTSLTKELEVVPEGVTVQEIPFGKRGRKPRPKPEPVASTPAPTEPKTALEEATLTALLGETLKRLGNGLKPLIIEMLRSPEVIEVLKEVMPKQPAYLYGGPPAPRHDPAPPSEPAKPKYSVVIAGLPRPTHVAEVKELFGDQFELRFFRKDDQRVQELSNMAKGADKVIVLTKHIGHKETEHLDTHKIPYHRLHAGPNVLIELLHKMVQELNQGEQK